MSCEREELLNRYIDGDVSAQEASEIRRHLSSCRECQAAYHEIQQREKALKDVLLPVIESMRLRDAVMRRITTEGIRPEPSRASAAQAVPARASRFFAYAVAFMLVAACGLVFYLNRPREMQEKQVLDMIVVMGLGEQSSFGRKILQRGNTCFGQTAEGFPVRGRIAFFVNGQRMAPIVFDGSATISLREAGIDWTSGEAVFETPAAPEFTLAVGEDRIRMTDAALDISGTTASYAVRLRKGTAVRFRHGAPEPLPLVRPAVLLPPKTATGTFVVASETASAAIREPASRSEPPLIGSSTETSSDAILAPAWKPASEQASPGEPPKSVVSPFIGRPITGLEGK